MSDRPVNRCPVRGCPVLGHWPEGGYCPMHREEEYRTARLPTLAEVRAAQAERALRSATPPPDPRRTP